MPYVQSSTLGSSLMAPFWYGTVRRHNGKMIQQIFRTGPVQDVASLGATAKRAPSERGASSPARSEARWEGQSQIYLKAHAYRSSAISRN